MTDADLIESLDAHAEWLLFRETGRSFPLDRDEVVVESSETKTLIGFVDDKGYHSRRLLNASEGDGEIVLEIVGAFGKERETLRLIPRVSARELTAAIELARLNIANEIASLIESSFAGAKLGRVALNVDGGRIAQIQFTSADRIRSAAVADVTTKIDAETLLVSAILWLEKLSSRKKDPVLSIHIIAEKRRSRELQKLQALLTDKWKSKIVIVAIERATEPIRLALLPIRRISELWREKARKLVLPSTAYPSAAAQKIIARSIGAIDVISTKQGETFRFHGLQFARVRTVLGRQRTWFGTRRVRTPLFNESVAHYDQLLSELDLYRSFESPNNRHEYYRAAPEAWLESILRRDISLLDANLIVSPIYNQFRSASEKIDLLALRRDGRLVVIEVKTNPDRNMVFQAADYWRRIELQRRRGLLADANLFGGREILDEAALVYLVAPAWSFHADYEFFASMIASEIEIWRFELHENWRQKIRVVGRLNQADGLTQR